MLFRTALPGDMQGIYLMGFDAWGDGQSESDYLEGCFGSPKYKLGSWYLAEDEGVPVSSLITYRDVFGLPTGAVGIGSVATAPQCRKRGYASRLIENITATLQKNASVEVFFLYSDIDPAIYDRLGFVALPSHLQRYKNSVCMAKTLVGEQRYLLTPEFSAPSYF